MQLLNDLSRHGCVIETDRNFSEKFTLSHSRCNFYLQLICKLPSTPDLWVSSTRGLTQTEVWTKHLQLNHVLKIMTLLYWALPSKGIVDLMTNRCTGKELSLSPRLLSFKQRLLSLCLGGNPTVNHMLPTLYGPKKEDFWQKCWKCLFELALSVIFLLGISYAFTGSAVVIACGCELISSL